MWAKKLAAMLTAAVMIFSAATPAFAGNNAEWEELYSKISNNQGFYIENDFIFVIGIGGVTKGTGNFYKKFARQAAKFDALRLLAEYIKGLDVDQTIDTENLIITRLEVDDILAKELSKARQVGEAKFSENGSCEVIVKLPYTKKK